MLVGFILLYMFAKQYMCPRYFIYNFISYACIHFEINSLLNFLQSRNKVFTIFYECHSSLQLLFVTDNRHTESSRIYY